MLKSTDWFEYIHAKRRNMKKYFLILNVLIFITNFAFGQIPNPSFETWTGQHPNGWRAYWNPPYSPYTFETQSTSAHAGTVGVKSDIVLTGPYFNPSGLYSASDTTNFYFPITTKPLELKGWFILQTNGLDTFTVNVTMKSAGVVIGQGEFTSFTTNLTYSEFTTNINYSISAIPDSMKIVVTFNHGTPWSGHSGSYFILDDLYFGLVDGINELKKDPSLMIFPNPAYNFISIGVSENNQIKKIEIVNSYGQISDCSELLINKNFLNLTQLANGLYSILVLTSDNKLMTAKFIKQ
jgi:hypothetical protein